MKPVDLSTPQLLIQSSRKHLILDMAGQRCFAGDTLVLTDHGYIPIKDINPFDQVMSVNLKTGYSEFKTVLNTFTHDLGVMNTVMFTLNNGSLFTCTLDHEIYFCGRWVKALEILNAIVNDTPSNSNYFPVRGSRTYVRSLCVEDVISVVLIEENCLLYDLNVEDHHNFCVTTENILVSNSGKTHNIGFDTGLKITNFPLVNGFIGANTDQQLSKTTIRNVKAIWKSQFGYDQYDKIKNPYGQYVVDKIPPAHFKVYQSPKSYYNTISFINGGFIYLGSLKNFLAHEGLEFGWAHLDEVADTKEEAVKDVILARLSQSGLYSASDSELIYFDGQKYVDSRFKPYTGDITKLVPFNPCYFHTSPKAGITQWLIEMFKLDTHEDEIKTAIMRNGGMDFYRKIEGNTEALIYSTYHNEKNLQSNYIENRKAELSELQQIKYIYGYPFSKTGGEFLPSFDRLIHCGSVPYLPHKPIHMSWDFNASPYTTCLLIQVVTVRRFYNEKTRQYFKVLPDGILDMPRREVLQVRMFKEYCLKSPRNSVNSTCEQFIADFEQFNPELFYYGDASGANRVPGHGDGTNFKTIKALLNKFLNNSSDRVPAANPPVMKSRDFVERVLQHKYPIEFVVDSINCPETVKDCEFVKEGPEGQLKEYITDANGKKYEKNGHVMSTIRYFYARYFKDLFNKGV